MRHVLPTALILLVSGAAFAGEGMWVSQQLPEIAEPLKQAGLELDPAQLSRLTGHPMGAVVSLGGCTGSFVSPEGLVITNHHCAYGAIQLNSTPQKNLIAEGFNAATLADEVTAGPNARVYVTEEIRDVTDRVLAAQKDAKDGLARQKAIEAAQKALIADCEAGGGYRCNVYAFFGGLTWRLFKQLEIKDVRLVYAPPLGIGNFGGEVDNWMWPRHTGDFSFLRAYVGRDGRPAPFAGDNVPYRPKHHLKIAAEGLEAGDFAMVAGYPARTYRYALAEEFDDTATWTYPTQIAQFKDVIGLLEAAGSKDKDVEIKYASQVKGLYNYLKNMQGQLEGFEKAGTSAAKRRDEAAVLDWLKSRGEAGRPALEAHAALLELNAAKRATRERDSVTSWLGGTGLLATAAKLYRLSIERGKPDAEREPGYQLRDEADIEGWLKQLERRYDAGADRKLVAYWLGRYVALPKAQRVPEIDAWLGGNLEPDESGAAIDKTLDALYAGTKLGATDARLKWFKADRKAIEASGDSALKVARLLMPFILRNEETRKQQGGDDARWRPPYLQAVIDYNKTRGRAVYPDANSSLRITFGKVEGYSPRPGTTLPPFTKLEQIAGKATGTEPFDAPQAELDAIEAGRHGGRESKALGTVPVNFTSSLDITGGNSGSPTLNARGELVGLVFDMNWESVASNWLFNPELTRCIHLDIRYALWVMEQVGPAPRLLEEMAVKPAR